MKTSGTKIDFKKDFKKLFSPAADRPEIIDVPDFPYIMVDGRGDPNTAPEFSEKIHVLYGLAFTIKFMKKKDRESPLEFTVPPLSGLWRAEDISAYAAGRREEWQWTLMILMPGQVKEDDFKASREELRVKKPSVHLENARFQVYHEGLSAQVMHLGPYAAEGPTIEKLHAFFQGKGYTFNGCHHEIYLGDPRRAKPEKLRTILRQPIRLTRQK